MHHNTLTKYKQKARKSELSNLNVELNAVPAIFPPVPHPQILAIEYPVGHGEELTKNVEPPEEQEEIMAVNSTQVRILPLRDLPHLENIRSKTRVSLSNNSITVLKFM